MTSFNKAAPAPDLLASEPQKTQTLASTVQPGLEHRPFSDEEIKEAFATFDLDNNRFVGAAEISHILKLIGEDVSHQEVDEMIRMCDSDGDGQVTFDEFYKIMTTPAPPLPPPVNSNKKKPYSDKLGGAKRYAKQLTETGPTFAQKAKEELSQFKGDWRAQQAAAGGNAQDRHHRSVTVEALIHKLSGGMGKIKPSQIKKIYKRFGDIDVDKSGAIDYEEFIQAMDMEDTNIARQMFRVFDMDGSGSIELKEFIVVLSRYTAAAKTEKLKFAFMMFDEDDSGLIDRRELVEMLRASFVVEGFSPEELEERADKIFDYLTLPRDGQIGYDDFLKLASTKNGLIYPVEEERRALGQDKSIDKYLKE